MLIVVLLGLLMVLIIVLLVLTIEIKKLKGLRASDRRKEAGCRRPDTSPGMMSKATKILKDVSDVSNVAEDDLTGDARNPSIVAARVFFTELCRREGITDDVTAKVISKDRTTVVHYRNRYKPSQFYNIIKNNYLNGTNSN